MIDMGPTNESYIYSTPHFVVDQAKTYGVTPVLTFDQSLWMKALQMLYLTTKETRHILCVNFLVVNEYDAHLSFHCIKLNKDRLRCSEII